MYSPVRIYCLTQDGRIRRVMSYTFLACLRRERPRLSRENSMMDRAFVLSRRFENTIYFVFLFTPDLLRGCLSINVGTNNGRRCRLVTAGVHWDRLQNFPEWYCRIALEKQTLSPDVLLARKPALSCRWRRPEFI